MQNYFFIKYYTTNTYSSDMTYGRQISMFVISIRLKNEQQWLGACK